MTTTETHPATAPTPPASELPRPTGPHPVGRTSFELVDPRRPEVYGGATGARRELVLWAWYPAAPGLGGRRAEHLPPPWAPIAAQLGLGPAGRRTHATVDAPVARGGAPHPVLLLSPSGFSPLLLSALAEQLASTGYVVLGVHHTYEPAVTAFADGRALPADPAALAWALGPQVGLPGEVFRRRAEVCRYKAADLGSVLDHLDRLDHLDHLDRLERGEHLGAGGRLAAEHLDLGRVGAVGHSFGGNAALEWCRRDPRCRAAANLDGALWTEVGATGLDRPVLQVLAEHPEFELPSGAAVAAGVAPDEEWYEAERDAAYGGWRTVAARGRPAHTLRVAGATHISFLDLPFLPRHGDSPVTAMLAATRIDPVRMWRITSDLVGAFFDRHLRGAPASLLDDPRAAHPEVRSGPP